MSHPAGDPNRQSSVEQCVPFGEAFKENNRQQQRDFIKSLGTYSQMTETDWGN